MQESVSASEPIHATTCRTSHVLSWTHFTLHPTHRASLASHSCCDVEREEHKVSAWSRFDLCFLLQHQLFYSVVICILFCLCTCWLRLKLESTFGLFNAIDYIKLFLVHIVFVVQLCSGKVLRACG